MCLADTSGLIIDISQAADGIHPFGEERMRKLGESPADGMHIAASAGSYRLHWSWLFVEPPPALDSKQKARLFRKAGLRSLTDCLGRT